MKRILLTFTLMAFLLAACSSASEPTLTAADVQGTAVAAAWTMVAATQAAIPTATPIPSATPLPTNTVPPLELQTQFPTQPFEMVPSPTATVNKDTCNKLMDADPDGPTFPLKIINETKAPVTISIQITQKTPFGVCGYRSYQVGSRGNILVTFPQGVMYGFAWINDPKSPTTASGGPWKPNNTDKWTVYIKESGLYMKGP